MSSIPDGKTMPFGSTLGYSTDAGVNYTDLTEIIMLQPPGVEVDFANVSVLDSPGAVKEFLDGYLDLGVVPFQAFLVAAQYAVILAAILAGTSYYFRIRLPLIGVQATRSTWVFQGKYGKLKPSEGKADDTNAFSYDGEIKIITGTGFSFTSGA